MTKKEDGTDRRDFLQSGLLGTAAAGLAITSTSHVTAQTVPDAAEPEVTNELDVLVVGGGTAGHVAAIQASCMGMGQAAGVAATLAAQSGTTPLKVPLTEIHALLRKHGQIIPGKA